MCRQEERARQGVTKVPCGLRYGGGVVFRDEEERPYCSFNAYLHGGGDGGLAGGGRFSPIVHPTNDRPTTSRRGRPASGSVRTVLTRVPNRLDRETSGLVLMSRTRRPPDDLAERWSEGDPEGIGGLGMARGSPTVTEPILRHGEVCESRIDQAGYPPDGRPSVTHFEDSTVSKTGVLLRSCGPCPRREGHRYGSIWAPWISYRRGSWPSEEIRIYRDRLDALEEMSSAPSCPACKQTGYPMRLGSEEIPMPRVWEFVRSRATGPAEVTFDMATLDDIVSLLDRELRIKDVPDYPGLEWITDACRQDEADSGCS